MTNGTRSSHTLGRSMAAAMMIVALAAVSVSIHPTSVLAIGTGFTYQGQLKKNGSP